MVRLEKLAPEQRRNLEALGCPTFEAHPWVEGPPLRRRRVAIISTAGLHLRQDRPFMQEPGKYYRSIPGDVKPGDLLISHLTVNMDRSGFQQDWNVMFPIERLRELAREGAIAGLAGTHYSFMGGDDPTSWREEARFLASRLKEDGVNAALLVPV